MGTQMNLWSYDSFPCGCLSIKLLTQPNCLMPQTHHPAFSDWVPVWLLLQSSCSDQRQISLVVDCLQTPAPLVTAALPVSQTLLQPQRWKHQPDVEHGKDIRTTHSFQTQCKHEEHGIQQERDCLGSNWCQVKEQGCVLKEVGERWFKAWT